MKKIKLLIVDDKKDNLAQFKRISESNAFETLLKETGHVVVEVETTSSALVAMEIIKEKKDIILLTDCFMPGEDTPAYNSTHPKYVAGVEVPYGFILCAAAMSSNIPFAMVSDLDHHDGFMQSMLRDFLPSSSIVLDSDFLGKVDRHVGIFGSSSFPIVIGNKYFGDDWDVEEMEAKRGSKEKRCLIGRSPWVKALLYILSQ